MSEKLFIESIKKLDVETLNQELVSGLYVLLNSDIKDRKIKQVAYNKINEWKNYKRKMTIKTNSIPVNKNAEEIKKPAV